MFLYSHKIPVSPVRIVGYNISLLYFVDYSGGLLGNFCVYLFMVLLVY